MMVEQSTFDRRLKIHNLDLKRTETYLEFNNDYFEWIDFTNIKLKNVVFNGCIFEECVFVETDFENCNIMGSEFFSCNFTDCTENRNFSLSNDFSHCDGRFD